MANRIVNVHAGICGIGIYAIMLPSSGFSVAHYRASQAQNHVVEGLPYRFGMFLARQTHRTWTDRDVW